MTDRFLRDNAADRALGKVWESRFEQFAKWYGKAWYAYQIDRATASRWQKGGRAVLTPDIQIFTDGGEGHEVKHKNPTSPWRAARCYGWEAYRLHALDGFRRELGRPAFYTIHDWEAAGAKRADQPMPNLLQDWRCADVQGLVEYAADRHLVMDRLETWLNGVPAICAGYYWPISLWRRLDLYWGLPA